MSTTTHTFIAAPAIAAITAKFTKAIGGQTFTADVASLSDASLAYLAEYGFAQSMGDTKALSILEKAKKAEEVGILPEGFTKDLTTADAAKALEAHNKTTGNGSAFAAWEAAFLAARAQARFDAILAGEMEFGNSERLSPEEKDRREITLQKLKEGLADAGLKLPKDKDVLAAQLAYVYDACQADIDKEVARRAKVRNGGAGFSLASLPGLPG